MTKKLKLIFFLAFCFFFLLFSVIAFAELNSGNAIWLSRLSPSQLNKADSYAALGSADGSFDGFCETYGPIEIEQCSDLFLNPYGLKYGPYVHYQQIMLEDIGLCMRDHTTDIENNTPKDSFVLDRAIITDSDIRFGMFKIGVGSPKWLVRLAYMFNERLSTSEIEILSKVYPQKMPSDPTIFALAYQGDGIRIFFQFDKTERVHTIMIDFS